MSDSTYPWQTKISWENRVQFLLSTGKMADCEIVVDSKKERFRCHKLILASSSPFLEAYFYLEQGTSAIPTAEFPDVNADSFRVLLSFIYLHKIDADPLPFHLVGSLLYAAKKFQILDFRTYFIDRLTKCTWPLQHILSIYNSGRYYNEPRLIATAKEHIIGNMESLLSHETLYSQGFSRFQNIMQMYVGKCHDLHMFKAIENYCIQNNLIDSEDKPTDCFEIIPKPENDTKSQPLLLLDKVSNGSEDSLGLSRNHIGIRDEDNSREKIEELCKLINFEDMTPQDFAEGPAASKLFNQNQRFEMLVRICKKHECAARGVFKFKANPFSINKSTSTC